jgi:hypothetical protein
LRRDPDEQDAEQAAQDILGERGRETPTSTPAIDESPRTSAGFGRRLP